MFDDQSLDIPCPECGRKTAKTIGWLKSHNQFACRCGVTINLKTEKFRRDIGSAEQRLRDFKTRLRRAFKS